MRGFRDRPLVWWEVVGTKTGTIGGYFDDGQPELELGCDTDAGITSHQTGHGST